ncbi:YeaH/YhbH family protein [Candidatus Parcubacteria bacterium]|nr:MAG: YeaH/YhbH family protein [Candidatus Parcubacteria bacterium]
MNIVDRRPNPKGKSLSNRQRFLGRARVEVRSAVNEALRKRKVADVAHGEKVSIPTKGISEPIFHHNRRTGRTDHVVPGNKEYVRGDEIPRPQGGEGNGGREGSPDGSGEDAFEFTLSREEFLDMFFEDLELPDLVKRSLKETVAFDRSRAGYMTDGSPSNLSVPRTLRNSMGRRIALRRPSLSDITALREKLGEARARGDEEEVSRLEIELERTERRSKIVPYIDPIDVRYRRYERVPKPNVEAVMFCLMDVSGSMTEAMKDLAKRFFMLLHVFLIRRYRRVDVVFIRFHDNAEECDEEKFFYSRETGGTVVSTSLQKMLEIARARYPSDRWNIYGAQASDGDNYGADSSRCVSLLGGDVLPLCQHFAYVEVSDGQGGNLTGLSRDSDLWRAYSEVAPANPNFAMKRVGEPSQIFAVFHELFAKKGVRA